MSKTELALKGRYQEIETFMEGDKIWPPSASSNRRKFDEALREVLSRLPVRDFDKAMDELGFILDDPDIDMLAVNAPALLIPIGGNNFSVPNNFRKLGLDNIVIFRKGLTLSPKSLIGLIAHEIAHSFINESDISSRNAYEQDEALVNAKARKWGFGHELRYLQNEKKKLFNSAIHPTDSAPSPAAA